MREEGLSMAEEIEWFVGIDWASQSHQVCLVDARGECLGERAVAHGGLGIEELCDWLIAGTGATPEVIGVAIEMTQGPVVEALLERGFCVYGINPSSSIVSVTVSPWPAPRACPRESGGRRLRAPAPVGPDLYGDPAAPVYAVAAGVHRPRRQQRRP